MSEPSKTQQMRDRIIARYKENPHLNKTHLAEELGTSLMTVKRTINRYKEGYTTERLPKSPIENPVYPPPPPPKRQTDDELNLGPKN